MEKIDIIFSFIFIIILGIGVFSVTSNAINRYHCVECSAPWQTAFYFPGGVFAILLIILLIVYVIVKHKIKK